MTGLTFAMPWIVGLCVFALYPFAASLYYSFTSFSVLRAPTWVGLENFSAMAHDKVFWQVLRNTVVLSTLCIVGSIVISLGLALAMNAVKRGQTIYSAIFYLPHLVPTVVSAIVWMWIFNAECGLLNELLRPFLWVANRVPGVDPQNPIAAPNWLSSWPISSIFILCMWGVGQTAFIYLATLQNVSEELYEACEIDGANIWQKIWHVTLPMISPVILFNTIMSIIGTLQMFTEPYIIFPDGGPDRAAMFMPHYIYENAFNYMRMGYACALSWVLFAIILVLTAAAFRFARDRVYYAGQ